jgi:ribosomal protein S17
MTNGRDRTVVAKIIIGLVVEYGEKKTVTLESTYHEAHSTMTRMPVKKDALTTDWAHQRWHEHSASRYLQQPRAAY